MLSRVPTPFTSVSDTIQRPSRAATLPLPSTAFSPGCDLRILPRRRRLHPISASSRAATLYPATPLPKPVHHRSTPLLAASASGGTFPPAAPFAAVLGTADSITSPCVLAPGPLTSYFLHQIQSTSAPRHAAPRHLSFWLNISTRRRPSLSSRATSTPFHIRACSCGDPPRPAAATDTIPSTLCSFSSSHRRHLHHSITASRRAEPRRALSLPTEHFPPDLPSPSCRISAYPSHRRACWLRDTTPQNANGRHLWKLFCNYLTARYVP